MSLARQIVGAGDKLAQQRALFTGKPAPKSTAVKAVEKTVAKLPAMIRDAAKKLASASTAAEVLDARDTATLAYDASKRAGRIAKAKGAHDTVVAAAHRAQADALEIEAAAKRRLADEYDGAQERGELQKQGGNRSSKLTAGKDAPATAAEAGVAYGEIHDARQIRDAIVANPTAVRDALDEILTNGDEPTRAALRKAIAPAVKKARGQDQEVKRDRRVTREIDLAEKITALPDRRYGVIVADPEWRFEPYSRDSGMDRSADNHYPTSATDIIAERPVASIAADDAVLFLWATAPMLPDAIKVMAAWGFTYKTHAIWFKQRAGEGRGTGYWFLGEHELLLVGTRGAVPAPAMGTQFRSVFTAPVGAHSEKPDVALEMIEAYFPTLPKIELNRRGPARPGWSAWGNEAESSDASVHPHAGPAASETIRDHSQAKASEDNGATDQGANAELIDGVTGEVSRPDAGRSASATSERMDATAGETAPHSRADGGADIVMRHYGISAGGAA